MANKYSDVAMESLSAIVSELEASYWVPLLRSPFGSLEELEAQIPQDCAPLRTAFFSFRTNILAAKELLEMPYLLIGPLLPPTRTGSFPTMWEELEKGAAIDDKIYSEKLIEFVTQTLVSSHTHIKRQRQLSRLMHQACLLIWSALETLCKEVFIAALNQNPSLIQKINETPVLKERFLISNSSWLQLLQAHDFDLNGKLGTILAAGRDFSAPSVVCDLLPHLFAKDGLGYPAHVFNREELWKLGQRRHLIAHRCSVVDKEYLDKTNDSDQTQGEQLRLRGRDVAMAMGAAASYSILLYGNARDNWPDKD